MFVRCKKRFKDGKEHRYWSVVESVRVGGGRVVQRQVLYLGEINDSQRAAWCRSIEVLEGASRSRQVALFPEDREAPELDCEVVQVRLAELTLHDPRQWGVIGRFVRRITVRRVPPQEDAMVCVHIILFPREKTDTNPDDYPLTQKPFPWPENSSKSACRRLDRNGTFLFVKP